MPYIKADNEQEQVYFDFLEELRQSGDTNMFGASPYLQTAFGLGRDKAIKILSAWMRGHDDPARQLDGPLSKQKVKVKIETVAKVTRSRRDREERAVRG